MDLAHILSFKYPGYKAVITDNDYNTMIWMADNEHEKPTWDDIQLAANQYEEYKRKNSYKTKRAKDYPSIEEQLDLLYHGGLDGWRSAIVEVKNKYPKQEGMIEKKPENLIEARVMEIENGLKELAKSLKASQEDKQDVRAIVSDVNSALSAINGFLLILPELQRSIAEIKAQLDSKE